MSLPLSPRKDQSHWSTTSSDYGVDEKRAAKEMFKGPLKLPLIREDGPPSLPRPKPKPGTPGHNGDIVITIARLLQSLPVSIACSVHVASPIMDLNRLRPFDIAVIALSGVSLLWVLVTVFLRHVWSWWIVAMDFLIVPGWVTIYLLGRLMKFDEELGTLMDLASWASIATVVIGGLVLVLQLVRFMIMRWRPYRYGLPPRKPADRDSIISNPGDRFQPSTRLPTQSILFSPPALHRQVSSNNDWLGPLGMARSPVLPTETKSDRNLAAPTGTSPDRRGLPPVANPPAVADMRGVAAGKIRPARGWMVESMGQPPLQPSGRQGSRQQPAREGRRQPPAWEARRQQPGRKGVAVGQIQPARGHIVESMASTVPESLRVGRGRVTMNQNRMTGGTVMSEINGAYANLPDEPVPPTPVLPAKNPARRLRNLGERVSRVSTGYPPRRPQLVTEEPRRQTRRPQGYI